jgi:hypothetical protein
VTDSKTSRHETNLERDDRHLSELLQELRVALPGVQVLFAFLLTVPFTERFIALSTFEKRVYFVTLMSTALATALLVAPTANHRLLFRKREKAYIVAVANRLAIAGLGLLALSMCSVVLLVTGVVFGTRAAIVTTAFAAVVFTGLWFVIPVIRRARLLDEPPP